MYRYAARRTIRNKKLFLAILVGVTIAATLFATSNIGANSLMGAMLTQVLGDVNVDMVWQSWDYGEIPGSSEFAALRHQIEDIDQVNSAELLSIHRNYTFQEYEIWEKHTYGIQHNSTVYDGMSLVSGRMSLGTNETVITINSGGITEYPIGSNYSIQIYISTATDYLFYNLTLEVVGHVELTDRALNTLQAGPGAGIGWPFLSIFIVDVESTFLPIFDYAQGLPDAEYVDIEYYFNINVDRTTLINPYNIQLSIQNLQQLGYQIENTLRYQYEGYLMNLLSWALQSFNMISESFRMIFLQISMPVFFIALYMGVTLNDVSYSIRRREVGLLLTKGITRGAITSLFVWEALLIGLIASIVGIAISVAIIPFFIGNITWGTILATGIGIDTIFLTIMFGMILAVFASYLPARKAAQIPTSEAIREYTLVGEPTGYHKMLAWTCLILGGYKLIIWLLGINVTEIAYTLIFSNPILGSLVGYWLMFDTIVAFWAPLFFLWGFTTILVKGWKGFYQYSQRFIGRILGDLGGLASHNIQRRPGRTIAIIFITALLVGYGIQTTGILVSSHDLALRNAYTTIGADIDATVRYPENVTDLLYTIRNLEGVRGAAGEYTFTIPSIAYTLPVRAINVSEWIGVAYYEPEWILGVPASIAFNALSADNQSIILQRLYAVQYYVELGDQISVQFNSTDDFRPLTVVGFMGPEPKRNPWGWGASWLAENTWSYVSVELMMDFSSAISPTGHVLIALDSPIYNAEVLEVLETMDDVVSVESAVTLIEEYNANVVQSSATNMMQMGVIFAFILASVGTLIIIYLTLRERRTTTALMTARGMTYSQTVLILSAEILTMMIFAILIGFIVGLIIYYGLISSGIAALVPPLLKSRFIPPAFLGVFVLQNGIIVSLLILTTLLPILIEARVARFDLSVLR